MAPAWRMNATMFGPSQQDVAWEHQEHLRILDMKQTIRENQQTLLRTDALKSNGTDA
jgi:hypothetical protein